MANIFGDDNANLNLKGTDGDDVIKGFGGVDNLIGGLGADQLFGGTGSDRAVYQDSNAGVTILLGSGSAAAGGHAEGDVLTGIENITGSAFADFIHGDDNDNLIDGFAGADTLKGLGGDDFIKGSGHLEGNEGDDSLRGGSGADSLFGGTGDDQLDGRAGADLLDGGAGVDTVIYEASNAGVTVIFGETSIDNGAGGHAAGDRLRGVENFTGSSFDDHVIADGARNVLIGRTGDDVLKGLGGADTIHGEIGADSLEGGDGADRLIGGFDGDRLDGGAGIDTADYFESNAGVTVDLGANTGAGGHAAGDTFFGVENVDGSEFADTIFGNGAVNDFFGGQGEDLLKGFGGDDRLFGSFDDDTLVGGDGADRLDGGDEDDFMTGGAGADVYVVGEAGDSVNELGGSGIDLVQSRISFSLSGSGVTGGAVENLTLTGALAINGVGNALANVLTGNAAANNLNGNAGADRMIGRGGNDNYVVNEVGDIVDESVAGGGIDNILSFVSLSLSGPQALGNVENLRLATGNAGLNAAGNSLANALTGNNGGNDLMGLGGNDLLTGGGGADDFVFNAALNAATNVDEIADFSVALDTIRLENAFMQGLATGTLAASAFRVGAAAADATDRIVYNEDTGNLFFDRDGAGGAAAVRFAELDADLAMTNADFFVV